MLRLLYHSRSAVLPDSPAFFCTLATLLSECLDNNVRHGITGVLTCHEGAFMQVLEGPYAAVEATFARINVDARHYDVTVLSRIPTDRRLFGSWSMAFVGPPVELAPIFALLDAPRGGADRPDAAVVEALARSVAAYP